MSGEWRARDLNLLDALDELERVPIADVVWRVVRSGRDPLVGHPSAGSWDPGHFDVLYTTFDPDGAVAEIHFHLSRQPVLPSKIRFTLNEIEVRTSRTLKFADLRDLEPLGVVVDEYNSLLYRRTQEIGDAAAFLGFDGIIAPSARWECLGLVIFSDCLSPDELELKSSTDIDWTQWRERRDDEI